MRKKFSIEVTGKSGATFSFNFDADDNPEYLQEWINEGFKISIVHNSIPVWVVRHGLLTPWIWVQNFWEKWLRLW